MEVEYMLDDLDKLVTFIIVEYNRLYKEWLKSDLYISINQKKNLVEDIKSNSLILNAILNYRTFINKNHLDLKLSFNKLKLESEVTSRVKAQNSIEYKMHNYMSEKHGYGKVPLNKCFNDLYGIRIIFKEHVEFNDIKNFIEDRYDGKLKCNDSSKGDYAATHIYFKNGNDSFQWELQVWDKEHEKSNIISHEHYKQDYTKWERANKGGVSFGNTLHIDEQ